MSRHGCAGLALLLAWTLTIDAVVDNGNGTQTLTVTARDETAAVLETRTFTLPTAATATAIENTIRHEFHQKKYPPPAAPQIKAGTTIQVP